MTDKTQPEALRLALSISLMDTFTNYQQEELDKAAAELRRQHTRIAELEAQIEALSGVQALSAAPSMPEGWTACTIEFDDDGPEEVAYGPKIMMDRLAKWLGKHFERTITEKLVPKQGGRAATARLPEHLTLAVDQWFAQNTGHGGCSDMDVAQLAAIFYGVIYDGGRESVDDALAVVEGFGPGIEGLNDTYARQVLLAQEVRRLHGEYMRSIKSHQITRNALRAALDHIEMDALRISHCKDAAAIDAARECQQAAPQQEAQEPYSIDADPLSIRSTVAEAITCALAFGAQGVNQPPEGHWLAPFWKAAREDKEAVRVKRDLRQELQQQCSTWGAYWRGSDAHGVVISHPQAVELLQIALGVEVEIEIRGCQTCDYTGVIGDMPCPDCAAPPTAQAEGWRPIETAPKDCQAILVTEGRFCHCVEWNEEFDWWAVDDNKLGPFRLRGSSPTHWMPLPPPPTSAEGVDHG